MAGIFLSYRRSDAEGQAGRLYDDLVEKFGRDTVFMDVAGIEAGRDFREAIDQHVTACGVLLAIIGKDWVSATDGKDQRRLNDPSDFVRLEIVSALKRGIPVVPVLVRGATMPQPEELPDDCKDLCFRNAVELTHARWDSDTELLVKALSRYVSRSPNTLVEPIPAKQPGQRAWLNGFLIALIVLIGGAAGLRMDLHWGDAQEPIVPKDDVSQRHEGGKPSSQLDTVLAQVDDPVAPTPPEPKPGAAERSSDPKSGQVALNFGLDAKVSGRATTPAGLDRSDREPKRPLSDWISVPTLDEYRKSLPDDQTFPYDIELKCVGKGENLIRAKFGPKPADTQGFRIGHFLVRGAVANLPDVEGFREFSRSRCEMPGGGQLIVRVMVSP